MSRFSLWIELIAKIFERLKVKWLNCWRFLDNSADCYEINYCALVISSSNCDRFNADKLHTSTKCPWINRKSRNVRIVTWHDWSEIKTQATLKNSKSVKYDAWKTQMFGVPAQKVARPYSVQNNYYSGRHSAQPTVRTSCKPFCLSQPRKIGLFSLCHVLK